MKKLKNWDNKTWLSSKRYILSINRFLKKNIKLNRNSKILDIGCGRGNIISSLNSFYKFKEKPIGLDIIKNNKNIKFKELTSNSKVSKVSIVGAGMVTTPGVTFKMFRALAEDNINILAISTSEIKLSVIINEENTLKAVKKLHTIFDLD